HRLACSSPPSSRRAAGGRGGLPPALVDGCPEGRADISLRSKPAPKRRSWSRTRKSWSRVARGRDRPPARWVQGEPKSPCVAMQRRSRCVSRDGLDARQRQRPAEQSLGETLTKSGRALGIAWGVRGGWEIPPQGGRGTTAHTLYVFE